MPPWYDEPFSDSDGAKKPETVRETIIRSIRETEATMAKLPPPSVNIQALADKAVLGLCEVLALLFVLPFGEDLYNDKPVTLLHSLYLAIGLIFAVGGPMFPWIRARTWWPERLSASLMLAALDMRFWIAGLMALFLVSVAPELYRRAQSTSPSTENIAKAVAPMQAQLDATKRELTITKQQLGEFQKNEAERTAKAKTQPHYDPSEIREMLVALRALRELVNKDVATAVIPQTNLINEWKRALDSVGAAAMAEKLKEMAAAMRTAEGKVSQLRHDEWHYADELKPVFGDLNALSAAQGTALDLAEQLEKYAKAQNVDISELVRDRTERWQIRVGEAYSWVTNTNNQIDTKTKQLRELAQ